MGIKAQDMVVELRIRYNMWLGDEDSNLVRSSNPLIFQTLTTHKNLSSQGVHIKTFFG